MPENPSVDRMKWFIVVTTTLGMFGILVMLSYKTIDSMLIGALLPLVGLVFSKWGSIVDFLFGSSAGSAKKTDMLSDIAGTGTGDGKSTTTATVKTDITKTTTTEPEPPKEQPKVEP